MILGVDHLALSVGELKKSLDEVEKTGYGVKFIHENLPNSPIKKPFLTFYRSVHAVAYCQASRGISLEITEHGAPLGEEPSFYQVLFDRPPVSYKKFLKTLPCRPEIWQETVQRDAEAASWRPFRAQFWHSTGSIIAGLPEIRAVLVPVSDLERSLRFWTEGLRAGETARGTGGGRPWVRLAWRTPIPRWSLEIILQNTSKEMDLPYLDSPGFPCLAFLSNDVAGDRLRLIESGARETSELSDHLIHGKKLQIAFARGPSGELVELIEVKK